MAEKKSRPEVRFKGFTDDWEQRKVKDVSPLQRGFDLPTSQMEKGPYPVVMSNGIGGYHSEFKVKGPGVATGRSGTIGKLHYIEENYWPHNTTLWVTNFKNNYPKFIYHLYQRIDLSLFESGSGVPTLNRNDVHDTFVFIPSFSEQRSISIILDDIDSIITLHQRKYEKLVNVKKSMLEKMFPQNGSAYPELRFDGFTDPWEYRVLGELFEEYSEKNHPELPALTIIQGGGTIRRDESDRFLQFDKASLSNYKMVNEGDFIVHLRSFEGGLEMATTRGVISPAYHTFHGENTDSMFYYSYFRSERFIDQDLKPHVYGIRDGRSIDIDGMKSIRIPWTSYEEQYKIGSYIKRIDTLITLHKDKLDKLKHLKQSMLQKMFV